MNSLHQSFFVRQDQGGNSAPDTPENAFADGSEGLVGRQRGPGRATAEFLLIRESSLAVLNLRRSKRFRNVFVKAALELGKHFLLSDQES